MFLTQFRLAVGAILALALVTAGVGARYYGAPESARAAGTEEDVKGKRGAPVGPPDSVSLLAKAHELEAAGSRRRQAEAALKEANRVFLDAQDRYGEAQDGYVASRVKERAKGKPTINGDLVKADAEGIRVGYWKVTPAVSCLAWETFPVAEDVRVLRDNARARLADLKADSRVTIEFDGKRVVRVSSHGGVVGGPVRFVAADRSRNTITVLVRGERRIYHLLAETEVVPGAAGAKEVRRLKEGTLLVLTLSAEDPNSVVRVEEVTGDN